MAAAILSSSPDAWTPLNTDLRPWAEDVVLARMEELRIDGRDLAVLPNEITQVIQLAQKGWGAQLGTGKLLGYWAAAALFRDMLTAHINAGVPTR